MRQAVSILLIAVIALAWANALTAGDSMPACCKVHHCSMKKHCGMGTSPKAPAKTYTILCGVLAVPHDELTFEVLPLASRRPPLALSRDIDHPPPALFF
jgi:hypothetical protein